MKVSKFVGVVVWASLQRVRGAQPWQELREVPPDWWHKMMYGVQQVDVPRKIATAQPQDIDQYTQTGVPLANSESLVVGPGALTFASYTSALREQLGRTQLQLKGVERSPLQKYVMLVDGEQCRDQGRSVVDVVLIDKRSYSKASTASPSPRKEKTSVWGMETRYNCSCKLHNSARGDVVYDVKCPPCSELERCLQGLTGMKRPCSDCVPRHTRQHSRARRTVVHREPVSRIASQRLVSRLPVSKEAPEDVMDVAEREFVARAVGGLENYNLFPVTGHDKLPPVISGHRATQWEATRRGGHRGSGYSGYSGHSGHSGNSSRFSSGRSFQKQSRKRQLVPPGRIHSGEEDKAAPILDDPEVHDTIDIIGNCGSCDDCDCHDGAARPSRRERQYTRDRDGSSSGSLYDEYDTYGLGSTHRTDTDGTDTYADDNSTVFDSTDAGSGGGSMSDDGWGGSSGATSSGLTTTDADPSAY